MSTKNPTGVNRARLAYLVNCLKLGLLSQHIAYKAINAEYIKAAKRDYPYQQHIHFV